MCQSDDHVQRKNTVIIMMRPNKIRIRLHRRTQSRLNSRVHQKLFDPAEKRSFFVTVDDVRDLKFQQNEFDVR